MNIAVNTRLLLPGKLEGLGRFAYETLIRITRDHPEHRFIFIFDRKFSDEFVFSDNIIPVVAHPQSRHPVLWYLFFDWGIPPLLKKHKADLFFSPDGWLSLRTKTPSIPVIHDLNFFHNPQWIEWAPMKYYNYFFPRFIKKAKHIVTVSEFSKKDICDRFHINKDDVSIVYNGSSEGFAPIMENKKEKVRIKYAAGKQFFLFVGLVHPRKNLQRTIEAFNLFKAKTESDIKLLIVGSTKYMTNEVKMANEHSKVKSDIFFCGRLPDSELKKVTASALAQIYVSLFEGFGIPILEAMNCETPVITSNTSSMPEVGGDAVLYADPYII
jgi:glycosyltransferase involved in cell wall biosynthesis